MINGFKEFIDIITEDAFRDETINYLKTNLGLQSYSVPSDLPPLYKYRALSKYSVDDLKNGRFTATAIGSFNDIFDGTIQVFGSTDQIKARAETDFANLEQSLQRCGFDGLIPHDHYVSNRVAHYKRKSAGYFRMADYLGTYVFCLSEKNDSTLMWAHYANENTGICIEYDFNKLGEESPVKKSIFRIAYTSKPIDLFPLIDEDPSAKVLYPTDTATLCAALNKAKIWEYEHEWRYVEINVKESAKRIQKDAVTPDRIIFGNRFLKPLFYYANGTEEDKKKCKDHFDRLIELLDYMIQNEIMAAVMLPKDGGFQLFPKNIPALMLKNFLIDKFNIKQKCEEVHLYYSMYNMFVDYIFQNEVAL